MHWKRQEGFSLVELAVVLVVAGIVLAIGAPPMIKYLNAQRVRDSARLLSDEIRIARQKAVTNGTRNWVYTSWGTNSAQYFTGIQNPLGGGAWSSTVWRGPIDLPSSTKMISANFSGFQYFWYEPNGRPNTSGLVKVVSTQPAVTDTATINVDLSGSVW
jgi:prepilin-type N-terminal cleavage/methylation domain-containing protein